MQQAKQTLVKEVDSNVNPNANAAPAAENAGEATPAAEGASLEVAVNNQPTTAIAVPDNIAIELDDVESTTAEDKANAIRSFVRSQILRQFGVVEVNKTSVTSGKLHFNGNRTRLKLAPVKTKQDGTFNETLRQYAERNMPEIKLWLSRSVQNAAITQEICEEMF